MLKTRFLLPAVLPVLVLLVGDVSPAAAAPPANDDLASSMSISPPGTAALSTVEATVQNLEPVQCQTSSIGKTVWFKYTPAGSQTLVADTIGSDFDTVLVAYSGPSSSPTFGALTYVACNDDSLMSLQSQVVLSASGGTTYYFQAAGHSGASGNVVFNLNVTSPPPNDNLATADSVSLETAVALSTTGATVEGSEWLECASRPIGKTVWFKYTAPADQNPPQQPLTADTFGSNFDTILTFTTGPSASPTFEALFYIDCNDNSLGGFQSQVGFVASAGTTYYFQVGGYGTSTSGNLVFTLHGPPPNDNLATANPVSPPAVESLSTVLATDEDSEPLACASIHKTVWFKYTPPADQTLIADTFGSGFDTILAVYSGPSSSPTFGALIAVACNDDSGTGLQSQAVFNASGGTTYYFRAGGFNDASGNLVFNLNADTDGDGVLDASDNCPNWPNAAQNLPPWTVPAIDPDCDGFTTAREDFMGTLPLVHCAATAAAGDEIIDAWPPDNNDDQRVTLGDVLRYIPVINSFAPGPPYDSRFDLNASSGITLTDVLMFIPFMNQSCAP